MRTQHGNGAHNGETASEGEGASSTRARERPADMTGNQVMCHVSDVGHVA
jgi:hypothetical protein